MEKLPLSELKDRLRWIKSNLEKSTQDYNGNFRYEIPFASFSDYSGCMVERANSKYLRETFDFITENYGGYGTVWTCIESSVVLDAIFSEDFPEFMEAINALHEYPVIDDDLLSQMETEAENDAWENSIRSDFQKEIEKQFRDQWETDSDLLISPMIDVILSDALDSLEEENLYSLFRDLCEISNQNFEIETGGNAWIDVEKLVESLPYKTLIEVVTGAYFIKPDAVQIPFKF